MKPKNNKEKGNIFEDFIAELLDLVTGLQFQRKNVRTETSEVDLHFSIRSELHEIYVIEGRVAVVECKDVDRTITVKDISHIVCELLERKITFGGFVANNYFSDNAIGRVRSFYKMHNLTIFCIDRDDLKKIEENTETVEEVIYRKIVEELQFQ